MAVHFLGKKSGNWEACRNLSFLSVLWRATSDMGEQLLRAACCLSQLCTSRLNVQVLTPRSFLSDKYISRGQFLGAIAQDSAPHCSGQPQLSWSWSLPGLGFSDVSEGGSHLLNPL